MTHLKSSLNRRLNKRLELTARRLEAKKLWRNRWFRINRLICRQRFSQLRRSRTGSYHTGLRPRPNILFRSQHSGRLCCGNARGIILEFEDPKRSKYKDIKQTLLKRFGSSDLVQIHEKALSDVKLVKGQLVYDVAHEIRQLTKTAWPTFLTDMTYISLAKRSHASTSLTARPAPSPPTPLPPRLYMLTAPPTRALL